MTDLKKFDTPVNRLILLVLTGLGIVGAFVYQLAFIARRDFYVAHHFAGLTDRIVIVVYILAALLVALWLILRGTGRTLPDGKWLRAVLVGGCALLVLTALFTHPTRSQDVYWNLLLGKGFSHYQMNPYATRAETLGKDTWAYPVLIWKDVTMIYGPIWTMLVGAASALTDSLGTALFTMKAVYAGVFALCELLFWKITGLLDLSENRRYQLAFLLAWNPFVIQIALVDLHNDLFLVLSFLASYYFLLKKNYGLSMLALLLGGFIKYVPWLFLVIPAYYLLRGNSKAAQKFNIIAGTGAFGALLAWLLFLPFGGPKLGNIIGFTDQVEKLGMASQFLPGTELLIGLFGFSYFQIRLYGIVAAVALMLWCLYRNKPLLAFTVPLLFIFFFGTPWFQPWYGLWVLPLLALYLPLGALVAFSIFLLATPELLSPADASLLIPAVILYLYAARYFWRLLTAKKTAA